MSSTNNGTSWTKEN
jgi:hypothetical protein